MKKLFPILLIAFLSIFIISCNNDDNKNYTDTVSEVYEIKNTNFSTNNNGYLSIYREFLRPLYTSDMVLIYRQEGTTNGNPIWTLVPKTYYTDFGFAEYSYDFTINDIQIYLDTNITDADTYNIYGDNQTFRVVVIPARLGRTSDNANSKFEDYNYVIQHYNINDKIVNQL